MELGDHSGIVVEIDISYYSMQIHIYPNICIYKCVCILYIYMYIFKEMHFNMYFQIYTVDVYIYTCIFKYIIQNLYAIWYIHSAIGFLGLSPFNNWVLVHGPLTMCDRTIVTKWSDMRGGLYK